jgi:hypothetical protein
VNRRWVCLLLVAVLLVAGGCGDDGRSPGLAERVAATILAAGESGATVELAAVTGFAWDRAAVYGPATSRAAVLDDLGVAPDGAFDRDDAIATSDYLLLFLDDGEVAGWDLLARRQGEGLLFDLTPLVDERIVPSASGVRVRSFSDCSDGECERVLHATREG